MDARLRSWMILHGVAVVVAGLLAGIPYAAALSGGDAEAVRAWRMAHLEGVLNGLLVVAVAAAGGRIRLGARAQRVLAWSLAGMAWANVAASTLGAATGQRGLAPAPPLANLVVFALFMAAVGAVFVGLAIAGAGALRAARED